MVLAEDVSNLDGAVLFKKGLELSSRHIEILQMWGVRSVEIEGEDDPIPNPEVDLEQFDEHIVAKAEELVNRRFALVKSAHPAVDIIKGVCVLDAAKALNLEDSQE